VDRIFDVAGMIVVLAMIATVLGSKNTKDDIAALGSAFSGSIKAATGR
jgi:hypothetical protein